MTSEYEYPKEPLPTNADMERLSDRFAAAESHLKVGGKIIKSEDIPGTITLGLASLGYGPGREFKDVNAAVAEFARVHGITEVDVRRSSTIEPDLDAVLPPGFDPASHVPTPSVDRKVVHHEFESSYLDSSRIECSFTTLKIRLSCLKDAIERIEVAGEDPDLIYLQVDASSDYEGDPEIKYPKLVQVREETDEEMASRARELRNKEVAARDRKYRDYLRLKSELGI
jgi:hypothetical protein